MKPSHKESPSLIWIYWSISILLLLTLASCDMLAGSQQAGVDPGLQQTQLAVGIQQTMEAQKSDQEMQGTIEAQQGTMVAQAAQATQLAQQATDQAAAVQPVEPTVDMVATQVAEAAQQTAQAQQATAESQQATDQAIPPPTEAPEATQPPPDEPSESTDITEMMQGAKILLYEDMIGNLDTIRYVKKTLDAMGLTYEDVGSAKGWLKSQLLSKGPDGKGWDLVIIAAEAKSGVSGEFFEYVNTALNDGASVILEVWYLDKTHAGTASTLLSRCGVEFEKDWANMPPERMVMFPLDPTHPIMQEPNSGLSFTDVTNYWAYTYDLGDWMKNSNRGDARLLVGTLATEKNTHGTLIVCLDGQFILQTYSSHQLTYDAMRPVWENYIYNALKTRFLGPQE